MSLLRRLWSFLRDRPVQPEGREQRESPLPVDTLLELKVFVDEHEMPVEVAASVRWADGQRMGIKFLRIRDPDRFRRFLGVGVPQDARSDS
ncbi:MAG: hypothetical protein E6K62_10130 [Nitrospirae bacterium]|nr:MAG: hypothetical protein E6K62_10130 [Nitrospirota bacterium]